jgi:uncharacterized protein YigA (DUF484 family)
VATAAALSAFRSVRRACCAKNQGLETRVVMIRHGNDNEVIASRLRRWTQRMLQVQHAQQVPAAIVAGLIEDLQIPQAGIRCGTQEPRAGL